MLEKSISKNSIILATFAFITAALIAITQMSTEKAIERNKQKALEKALYELISKEQHDNQLLDDKLLLAAGTLSNRKARYAYFAFKDAEPYALILPASAPDGYGGEIQLIVGIYFNGKLAGVRIVPPHNETPGLGDGIEVKKSPWMLSFNGKSLQNPQPEKWAVKKDGGDFDQMTGATITPRAVINAVYKTLIYFEQNQANLLAQLYASQNQHLLQPSAE